MPTSPVVWSQATVTHPDGNVVYSVPISGVPDASVEVLVNDGRVAQGVVTLDDGGRYTVTMTFSGPWSPTALRELSVTFRYLFVDGSIGPSVTTTLGAIEDGPTPPAE